MSYAYEVIADYPFQFFPLNPSESPFLDYSGNGTTATNYGSQKLAQPLVTGGGNSFIFSNTVGMHFPSTVFIGPVSNAFSLECWFRPVVKNGLIQILGHETAEDGILYDNSSRAVIFRTQHGSEGYAEARWLAPTIENSFYAVGVHTGSKNQLYVNGNLVSETELTVAQINAGYTITTNPGRIQSGKNISGSGTVQVDAIATYKRPISDQEVSKHFLAGRAVPDFREIAAATGGNLWTFTDDTSEIADSITFASREDWLLGKFVDLVVEDDITASFGSDSLSRAGKWEYGLILSHLGTLGGSKIEYEYEGVLSLEVSLNEGVSWQSVTNGQQIPGLVQGYNTSGKSLTIRVSIPSGQSADVGTRLTYINLKFYSSISPSGEVGGRNISFSSNASLSSFIYQPIEQNDRMGLGVHSGYVTVSSDLSESPVATRTFDMWIKLDALAAGALFDSRVGGAGSSLSWNGTTWVTTGDTTVYIDGVLTTPSSTMIEVGRWHHVVIVIGTGITTAFTLGGSTGSTDYLLPRIGSLALYPQAFNATDSSLQYRSYLGVLVVSVLDSTKIRVLEASGSGYPAKVYDRQWTTLIDV